ncbi:MAG TPA: diguanylate cyclase [Candidatus Saccharimonadia bacterium]|nr:diguanylate cyclase [Candidatus Saccharimonadia bacterium]
MRLQRLLVVLLAVAAGVPATRVKSDDGTAPVEIARLDVLGGPVALDEVRRQPEARWIAADAIRRQPSPSWWRIRLTTVPPATPTGDDWVLAIREAFDGELVAYVPPHYRAETLETFDPRRRQLGSRHRLAIEVPAGERHAPVYVQLLTARGQPMQVSAAPAADYLAEDSGRVRFTSMILSALLILAVVAAMYAVALRRWMLLLFCFWVLSAAVYVLVMSGEVVWFVPHEGVLRNALAISGIATNLGVLAVYGFVIGFLGIPRHYPRLARVMQGLLAFAAVSIVVLLVNPRSGFAIQLLNIATISLSICSLGAAVARARAGSPQGWFFLFGWGILTVMGTLRAWRFLTYQGTPPWLELAHPAAYVFGAVVIVVATARAARYAEREMQAARVVARTDPLTLLPNRSELDRGLATRIARARELGDPLSVMFVDLDRFKSINDRFGHAAGDQCLAEVGRALRRHVRADDLLVRYGGEEFVLVLEGTTMARAAQVAEILRQAVSDEHIEFDGQRIALTTSIGVTDLRNGDGAGDLLARADAALYRAKAEGRDRVVLDAAVPAAG